MIMFSYSLQNMGMPKLKNEVNWAARRLHLVCLLCILAGNVCLVQSESSEVCIYETFQASCSHNEVIMMTSAEFGRMKLGRCITKDMFMGCTNNVLPVLNRQCSGRRECQLPYIHNLENENRNCSEALKMYLQASYTCIKVDNVCSNGRESTLSNAKGYLVSSDLAQCNLRSPLTIQAELGQTINMSIIDFAANDQTDNYVSCKYVYGYILERALGINHTICGGRQREMALYTSKTNKIEIHILSQMREEESFLISYTVIGCPDVRRPPHTSYRREGNQAVIGCEINGEEWTLTCTGNTWEGRIGNCTQKEPVAVVSEKEVPKSGLQVSSVVVMTAVAGGAVVLVVVVIVIGVVYLNKYRMKQETKHMQKTYSTIDRNLLTQYRPVTGDTMSKPPLLPGVDTLNKAQDNFWLVPASDHSDLPLPPYPGQCECGTLPVTGTGNSTLGTTSSGRHSLYNSIT